MEIQNTCTIFVISTNTKNYIIMNFQKFDNGDYNSDCPNIGIIANKVKHTYNPSRKRGSRVSFVGCNRSELGKGRKFRIAVEFRIEDDAQREYSRMLLKLA